MAQNTRITVAAGGTWVQLTNGDVAADMSVMLANSQPVMLQATANDTPPTAGTLGPLELLSHGDGWSEATIAEKFPGVASAVRLWARTMDANIGRGSENAYVGISHAA